MLCQLRTEAETGGGNSPPEAVPRGQLATLQNPGLPKDALKKSTFSLVLSLL